MRYLLRKHAFLLVVLALLLGVFLAKTHRTIIADWTFDPNLPIIRFTVNCGSPQINQGSTPYTSQLADSSRTYTCSGTTSIKIDQFDVLNCIGGNCNTITWTNSAGTPASGTVSPGGSVNMQVAGSGSTTITAKVTNSNLGNISFKAIAIINFSNTPPPATACPGKCGNNAQPVPQMSDSSTCTDPWNYTPGTGRTYDTWCGQQAQGAQYPYCWTCTPVTPTVVACPGECGYNDPAIPGGLPAGVCNSPSYWQWNPGAGSQYDAWCADNKQPRAYCYNCVTQPTPPPANACPGTCGNESSPTTFCNGYWSWYNNPTYDAGCAAQNNGKDYCYQCIGNPPPPPPPPTYSIQGRIYVDIDHSGTQNIPPDSGGGQWTVFARNIVTNNIYNASGPLQASDGNGYYTIGGMPEGQYQIGVEKRPGYCYTTRNNYATITVSATQPGGPVDFGVAPIHTLSGNWFIDYNRGGTKNTAGSSPAAPAPIPGVTADAGYAGPVTISSLSSGTIPGVFATADGNWNCTTFNTSANVTTNASGNYSVSVLPGDFRISATAPTGYKFNFLDRSGSTPTSATVPRNISTGTATLPDPTLTENLAMSPFWLRGKIFVDYDTDGLFNGIDKYWTSANFPSPPISPITITMTGSGAGTTTNQLSDSMYYMAYYPVPPGTYTVTMTDPPGYTSVYPLALPNPKVRTNPTNDIFEDFSIAPPYTIKGYVFNDINKNQSRFGNTESGVGTPPAPAGGFNIDFYLCPTSACATRTFAVSANTNSSGYYNSGVLQRGWYQVVWDTTATPLPGGFIITQPLNMNPPSYTVYLDAPPPGLCNTGGSPDAVCVGGIDELNFGITNEYGWVQGVGGDMRVDRSFQNITNGFIDPIPQGSQYAGPGGGNVVSRRNAVNSHGVLFTDGQTFNFCSGNITGRCQASASVNQWIIGQAAGSPNKFGAKTGNLQTSYKTIKEKLDLNGIVPTQLNNNCGNTNGCNITSPNRGVYTRTGDTYISGGNINGSGSIIILIDGNLTIKGGINVTSANMTGAFIVSGDITIDPAVGSTDPTNNEPHLMGFYSADGAFIVNTVGNQLGIGSGVCNADASMKDRRLNIHGAAVANAAGSADSAKRFINYRTLCASDLSFPAVFIEEAPDLLLFLPEIMKKTIFYGQEVAP